MTSKYNKLRTEMENKLKVHEYAIFAIGSLTKLKQAQIKELKVFSKSGEDISIDTKQLMITKRTQPKQFNKIIKKIIKNLNQVFIGGIYELLRDQLGDLEVQEFKKTHPEFEFFYHCRNASFHNNRFIFRFPSGEKNPPKNAHWRTLKITRDDEGKEIFYWKLQDADSIKLVSDIARLI